MKFFLNIDGEEDDKVEEEVTDDADTSFEGGEDKEIEDDGIAEEEI